MGRWWGWKVYMMTGWWAAEMVVVQRKDVSRK